MKVKEEEMDLSTALEAILSSSSDAIISTDREGIIRFWNPGAVRIFGFTETEAVGQSLDIIIPENQRKRHWEGFARTMQTGASRYGAGDVLAVPSVTRDGRRISVEFTIVLLRDKQQNPTGTVAILRDVSRRFEETRELKRKLAAQQAR